MVWSGYFKKKNVFQSSLDCTPFDRKLRRCFNVFDAKRENLKEPFKD